MVMSMVMAIATNMRWGAVRCSVAWCGVVWHGAVPWYRWLTVPTICYLEVGVAEEAGFQPGQSFRVLVGGKRVQTCADVCKRVHMIRTPEAAILREAYIPQRHTHVSKRLYYTISKLLNTNKTGMAYTDTTLQCSTKHNPSESCLPI